MLQRKQISRLQSIGEWVALLGNSTVDHVSLDSCSLILLAESEDVDLDFPSDYLISCLKFW